MFFLTRIVIESTQPTIIVNQGISTLIILIAIIDNSQICCPLHKNIQISTNYTVIPHHDYGHSIDTFMQQFEPSHNKLPRGRWNTAVLTDILYSIHILISLMYIYSPSLL